MANKIKQTFKKDIDKERKYRMSFAPVKKNTRADEYTRNQMRYNDTHGSFGVGWGGEKTKKKK